MKDYGNCKNFYDALVDIFNELDPAKKDPDTSLSCFSPHEALARYSVMERLPYLDGDNWEYSSLLDVGAGVGNFHKYLGKTTPGLVYVGLDICKGMADIAQKNGIRVHHGDVFETASRYDWVVANGAFNIAYSEDSESCSELVTRTLDKMWDSCEYGMAFDLLKGPRGLHISLEKNGMYFDPLFTSIWIRKKTQRWIMDTSSLENSVVFYMYRGSHLDLTAKPSSKWHRS